MTEFILQYWTEMVFTLIISILGIGYKKLVQKLKENDKKQNAIEAGIEALLRDRIILVYNHYMEKGFCPIYGMQNVEALYEQYHALGGNGTVTKLVEKLKALPTEKEE